VQVRKIKDKRQKRAERKEFAQWTNLATEPACMGGEKAKGKRQSNI
jgi:hypothetical protein